jgi:hypothetical protein
MDGLQIPILHSSLQREERAYYTRHTHIACVKCVFIFTPDGTIAYAVVNAPGSWHDSVVAQSGRVYDLILEHVPLPFRVLADSAFAAKHCEAKLITTRGAQALTRDNRTDERTEEEDCCVKIRQSVEWGMRGFKSAFPRFKAPFSWESKEYRQLALQCACHLYNLRTRVVGKSQIRSVWLKHLVQEPTFAQ